MLHFLNKNRTKFLEMDLVQIFRKGAGVYDEYLFTCPCICNGYIYTLRFYSNCSNCRKGYVPLMQPLSDNALSDSVIFYDNTTKPKN